MAHLLFILVCCIWGSSFALMDLALRSFGHMDISFYRALGGSAILLTLWLIRSRHWPMRRDMIGPVIFLALVGYALPYALQPYVIRQVGEHVNRGSSFMGLVIALVPLFTVGVQAAMMRILPSPREWFGVLGGLAMLTFLAWDEVRQGVPLSVFLLAACVPLAYAVGNTYVKHRFSGVSSLALTIAAMSTAALMLMPLSLMERPAPIDAQFPGALAALVILALVCTGIGSFVFYRLIQAQGPLFAGMVGYIIPAVAMVIGAVMRERITWAQIVTLLGVLAMVAVVQYRPRVASIEQLAAAEAREGS